MKSQTIEFVRNLNQSQKKRIYEDHKASVALDHEGNLQSLSKTILTPKGFEKENKLKWVVPSPTETIKKISEVNSLFSEISHMNIILTNACNLSCTYCYEQHNKDYGRFTNESLLSAYNFLLKTSKASSKAFQFFGGEPLIHKDLILDFLDKNKEYLSKNAKGENNQIVSMITNGLLLTDDFIKEYFQYDFTWLMVSLDTLDSSLDHRQLKQVDIDNLLKKIDSIPHEAKNRVVMRCTISRETAPLMEEYIKKIYSLGVRDIVIHPLILDSSAGFIKWSDSEWNTLHKSLISIIDEHQDLSISFSEGVGKKKENNCMIGSDMIAIDGSGDFSGCYFFTNQKGGPTNKMILGNIFNDTIYTDRYHEFQKNFLKMFEEEEQCKTCDYKERCYQCPAGNMDTGSQMFRPDDMCQKIVKLYLDLQDDVIKKQFKNKYEMIYDHILKNSEHEVFNKLLLDSMFMMYSGRHSYDNEIGRFTTLTEDEICGIWKYVIVNKIKLDVTSFENFNKSLPCDCDVTLLNIKNFYEWLSQGSNLPIDSSKKINDLNLEKRVGYLVLIQHLVYNLKAKNIHSSFTKELIGN